MKRKNLKASIILYMFLFLITAIAIETNILSYTNRKQVSKTSKILLEEIDNVLTANEHNKHQILEDLKIDYLERAKSVAYILDTNKHVQNDINELKKIADIMHIDEINLFDSNGVIFSGTHPNYYGYSVDSGEQISYFKPMLKDKNLTMCQDVTPNTAEAKSMMYAIVWNNTKQYMVQVGIEPVRLLAEFKENGVSEVIAKMPVYKGMSIIVSDRTTGEILGATDKTLTGDSIFEIGVLSKDDDLQVSGNKVIILDKFKTFCYYKPHENYVITVIHSTKANIESFLVSIFIEIVWVLIAGTIIIFTLLKLANANRKIKHQMSILSSLSDIYYSMHLIDLTNYKIEKLEGNALMDKVLKEEHSIDEMLKKIICKTLVAEYVDAVLAFVDISTLHERLKGRKEISMDTIDKNVGWLRISFIAVDDKQDQESEKVILTTQIINEDKKREEELSIKANRDELTGLLNRRAYEDDLLNFPSIPPEEDFVYAAIDINGLKAVNDNLGHAAGDEMIRGAAECLKMTLGNYGRIYRTGGDEFVSIFFADEKHLNEVTADLEKVTNGWKGEQVESLTLSAGFVSKREFQDETVVNISKIADKRMYEAKKAYYSRKGVDRRGQMAAHTALCNLYAKILKINLTEDTYSIVNMDSSEQTSEKGFSNKISEWLYGFGKSGQVHAEDLDEYHKKTDLNFLKDYFKHENTSISIFYRRKFGDVYKHVVMEMIPANDYTDENQTLFLYVKTIEK